MMVDGIITYTVTVGPQTSCHKWSRFWRGVPTSLISDIDIRAAVPSETSLWAGQKWSNLSQQRRWMRLDE